jgi:hypothetical protein
MYRKLTTFPIRSDSVNTQATAQFPAAPGRCRPQHNCHRGFDTPIWSTISAAMKTAVLLVLLVLLAGCTAIGVPSRPDCGQDELRVDLGTACDSNGDKCHWERICMEKAEMFPKDLSPSP